MIIPNQHEKMEWARMAQAAYFAYRSDVGHVFAVAATLRNNEEMDVARFDWLQDHYRNWLCFNVFPPKMGA